MAELDQHTNSSFPLHGSREEILTSAINYVITGSPKPNLEQIGDLNLPSGSAEASRCRAIRDMISSYEKRDITRPLSFAVFGPPGSGKSFCVKEIVRAAGCKEPFLINLSQLSTPEQLAQNLNGYLTPKDDESAVVASSENPEEVLKSRRTKVIFFDEFDAPLASEPLGWLRWFLSPMQDGNFFLGSKAISVEKAIFMFAGGTAISLAEFEKHALEDPDEYRNKKVPDFISRLRGFIDLQGIDSVDNEGIVRRALILRRFLNQRWRDVRQSNARDFPIDREMTEDLLSNIHFVHGVRSMEALLDMCFLDVANPGATVQLPEKELRKLHLSRGSLDGKIIGISAGHEDAKAKPLMDILSESLLQHGATLAYGGDFVPGGPLSMVIASAKKTPDKLIERDDRRIRNYLAFPTFKRVTEQLTSEKQISAEKQVEFIKLDTLSDSEIAALHVPREEWFAARDDKNPASYNPNHHLAWAISLFRMRARLIQDVDALIVLGGKNDGKSWGRFSGIAEEVMLALALRKPVYVLGGRGGGAQAVGQLLGLDSAVANPNTCLADDDAGESLSTREFTLPGLLDLPRTTQDLRIYLFERGITTNAWPRNGLSPEENRKVFKTPIEPDSVGDAESCVKQIIKGLLRLDGNTPSRPPL